MDISVTDVIKAKDNILDALAEGKKVRLSMDAERALGMASSYYLAKYILGYKDLNNNFHRSFCDFNDKYTYDNTLVLCPRKHFKTTCKTITGSIRLSLLDPDIAICIMANTMDNSGKFLFEMKDHYINNDKFRDLYQSHAVQTIKGEGTSEKFTTPARKQSWKRSATFEVASANKAVVSRHYDLVIFDDLSDQDNSHSVESNNKVYEVFAATLAITGNTPDGKPWHHLVGTRWAYDDPYSMILNDPERLRDYKALITQAEWEENGETRYLFPERFSPKTLEVLKRDMKTYLYSCLYLNTPLAQEDALLDPAFLKYYRVDDMPKGLYHRVMTVDPAGGGKGRTDDPSVISVFDMDHNTNIYIREVMKDYLNPEQLVSAIVDMYKRWTPRILGVEKVSLGKWLEFWLLKEFKDKEIHGYHYEGITRDSRITKGERLKRIIPYLRNGKIYVREDEPHLGYIKREFREWSPNFKSKYDHFLDTLADAIEILKAPAKPRKRASKYRLPPVVYKNRRNFQTGYSYRSG